MAKFAVFVTGNGELDYSSRTKAYQNLARASMNGCNESKNKAREIADDWDERAKRCDEVGSQSEFIRGTTVELDYNDCKRQSSIWREISLNMTKHGKPLQECRNPSGVKTERTRKDWRLRQLGEIEWKL